LSDETDLKIGIFSDIHLMPDYDPMVHSSSKCMGDKEDRLMAEISAPIGRQFCDCGPTLVKYMFDLFLQRTENEPVDYIFLNGDLVGHKIAIDFDKEGNIKNGDYKLLKEIHAEV